MIKKILMVLFLFLLGLFSVNAVGILDCEFKENACLSEEKPLFYVTGDESYRDSSGKVLSSPIGLTYNSSNYNTSLCCQINIPDLNKNFEINVIDAKNSSGQEQSCVDKGADLLYFTSEINGRVGFKENSDFNISHFDNKSCVKLDDKFSSLSLLVADTGSDFSFLGYECLFKTNDLYSGVVSDCDAVFNPDPVADDSYEYTVWARLWENLASLKCDPTTCTSKLDNRVYSACSQKSDSCAKVPAACDGALYDSWISTGSSSEVQCSAPWNQERSQLFTDEDVQIESDESCSSLINNKYSVLVDNELVVMNIYICAD